MIHRVVRNLDAVCMYSVEHHQKSTSVNASRFGRVSSEYDAASSAYHTTGDFDQDYAALSAEYGMTFRHESGFFVEPQMQVQAAFLKSYDYDSDRGMRVDVDGDTSILGRPRYWGVVGFGGAVSWGDAYGLQLDVEHAFGGDVDNTWLISGRFRYTF